MSKTTTNSPEINKIQAILIEKTKDFHDRFIDSVRKYAKHTFEEAFKLKNLSTEDFMSYFGAIPYSEGYKYARYQITGPSSRLVREYFYKMCSPFFVIYKAKKESITFNGKEFPAREVHVIDRSQCCYLQRDMNTRTDEEKAYTPSSLACQMISFKNQVAIESSTRDSKWNKQHYIDKAVDDAEKKYVYDMFRIAEKIAKTDIDVDNMKVVSQYPDAKHYDITMTDGKVTAHARSVFAAEFSDYVSPHYRFIITTPKKK